MPESTVHARKSIHDHTNSHREESDQEGELLLNESQDPMPSGSDEEKYEVNIHVRRTYKIQDDLNISRIVSRTTPGRSKTHPVKATPIAKCTQCSKRPYILKIFSVILILITTYIYILCSLNDVKNCSFENLQKQYPRENPQLWSYLKIGIESILNKRTENPMVYLFAHYGGQQSFELIKDIAAHSSNCFGKKFIPMESDDFISAPGALDDYGYAIAKYRNKIKEGNVILIANLNEIPAEAARALHAICDTYSPIAKNVVIFLTLTIQANREGNPNTIAEETLNELWGSILPRNELDPLITRVTDQVIILKSSEAPFIN